MRSGMKTKQKGVFPLEQHGETACDGELLYSSVSKARTLGLRRVRDSSKCHNWYMTEVWGMTTDFFYFNPKHLYSEKWKWVLLLQFSQVETVVIYDPEPHDICILKLSHLNQDKRYSLHILSLTCCHILRDIVSLRAGTVSNSSFPGGSDRKEFDCNARDLGSIPGLGRSPGEGYLLQCSCLENYMDRGAW